jgi:predicted RNase H-like HicB family nuclease
MMRLVTLHTRLTCRGYRSGDTRQETESLMIEAMAEHIRVLRQTGQPVPEPSEADSVAILDPAAA